MNWLKTLGLILPIVVVTGVGLAWFLRRTTIAESQKILRDTNKDLLDRLNVVEALGEACKEENQSLRKQQAELQVKYDHLFGVVSKEAIERLVEQLKTGQGQIMSKLDVIEKEFTTADLAARKDRAPSGKGYATQRKTKTKNKKK